MKGGKKGDTSAAHFKSFRRTKRKLSEDAATGSKEREGKNEGGEILRFLPVTCYASHLLSSFLSFTVCTYEERLDLTLSYFASLLPPCSLPSCPCFGSAPYHQHPSPCFITVSNELKSSKLYGKSNNMGQYYPLIAH